MGSRGREAVGYRHVCECLALDNARRKFMDRPLGTVDFAESRLRRAGGHQFGTWRRLSQAPR